MKGEVEEGEVSERRPQPTRDEMKMFIGQAMQSQFIYSNTVGNTETLEYTHINAYYGSG